MEEKKNLEIVSGDGSNLDISPAYDHLNATKPKSASEKPTNIVIPKSKNSKDKDEKDDKNADSNDNKKG
jgi:hypothetical protein